MLRSWSVSAIQLGALIFHFYSGSVAAVPPPDGLTLVVNGVNSFQVSWSAPQGWEPGVARTVSGYGPKQYNSSLDQYTWWVGTSATSFPLSVTVLSPLPTAFVLDAQTLAITTGTRYYLRIISKSCCSGQPNTNTGLPVFAWKCSGLTCTSSATSFSTDATQYPLDGYAQATAVALGEYAPSIHLPVQKSRNKRP